MMFLLLALACGIDEPLMQPNPPPGPPDIFKAVGENEVTVSGNVSTVSGDTRTWVQTGDGQTVIGHLPPTGVLTINGRTSVPSDLQSGMTIKTHGHQQGDLVVVMDAQALSPAAAGAANAISPGAALDAAAAGTPGTAAPTATPAGTMPAPTAPGTGTPPPAEATPVPTPAATPTPTPTTPAAPK